MVRHPVDAMPRRRKLMGCLLLALAATQISGASAQGSNRGAQAVSPALQEMRKAWASAVQRSDGAGAAALAVLPLQFEGYQAPRTVPRSFYLGQVPHWSTLKGCLATEKLERVKGRSRLGTHTFNCDGHGFFFAEKSGVWRHTGYENSNE
jgi:hypothetical protein